jgi:hypothetical protein
LGFWFQWELVAWSKGRGLLEERSLGCARDPRNF